MASARRSAVRPSVTRLMARWCASWETSQQSPVPACEGRGKNRVHPAPAAIPFASSSRWRDDDRLEQAQLLGAASRRTEMISRQLGANLVEAEFLAGKFETPADHPGDRAA